MHLHRESPRLRLTFALSAGALTKTGQVLLTYSHIPRNVIPWAGVIDEYFEVHLRFSAKTLDVCKKVALVRPDRTTKCIIILKSGSKAKRQDRGMLEAVSDDACVVFLTLLIHPRTIFSVVLGYDYSKIAGWKEKCLISKQAGDSGQRHRTTMPTKLRKGLSLCNAIGVPCHRFLPSLSACKGLRCPAGSRLWIHPETKGLEKLFIYDTFASRTLRDKRTVLKPKRILSRLNDGWQEFLPKKMHRNDGTCIHLRSKCSFYPVKSGPTR